MPLAATDAVALFNARSCLEPDDAVADLCRRLDSLPLAIELAAARTSVLSPSQILERLSRRLDLFKGGRDADARQNTLRASIQWSYELLDDRERRLLALLTVFAGGCTLAAAEEVAGAQLDSLQSLVDKSLVRHAAERFWMLETIREYGRERLEGQDDADDVRRRHAKYVLAFAQTAREFARGPGEFEWLDRVQAELDNIRAALAWAIERGEGVLGLTLAEALEPFWCRRAQYREGLRWMEQLLELAPDAPVDVRAGAFGLAGRLASELNSVERARAWYEQSLPLARAAGDRRREAWALHGLGFVSDLEGDRSRARDLLEQSYALFAELGEHGPAGGRLTYLAALAQSDGDIAAMRAYLERALAEFRIAGDVSGVLGTQTGLGDAALEEGDWAGALGFYKAALPDARDPLDYMYLFAGLGSVAARTGRRPAAARLWGAAERIESETDLGFMPFERELYLRTLGELDANDLAVGRALSLGEALAVARELVGAGSPTGGNTRPTPEDVVRGRHWGPRHQSP